MPPHTTKRRTTTHLKTKQPELTEIELNGNLTTKELKKKHSSRPVGGAETGSRGEVVAGGPSEAEAWGLGGPTFVFRLTGRNN